MKRYFENLALAVFAVIFIVSCYKIMTRMNETNQSNDVVNSLEIIIEENKTSLIAEPETDSLFLENGSGQVILDEERMIRLSSFSDFYSINNDFIGWIQIPGTKVNYPVVQNQDNPDDYIKKDFYGKKSSHGSIYVASQYDLSGLRNIVLFGHHMKDGTMFASINKYQDMSYYKEHPIIYFDTVLGAHDYEIIGAFRFNADETEQLEELLSSDTKEKFNDFISYIKEHSYYETGITAEYGDMLLTLMTCEYTYDNGRFFVVAKRTN